MYTFLDVTRLSRAHLFVIFRLPELRYLTSNMAFRVSSRKSKLLRATACLRTVKDTVTGQAYFKFNILLTYYIPKINLKVVFECVQLQQCLPFFKL